MNVRSMICAALLLSGALNTVLHAQSGRRPTRPASGRDAASTPAPNSFRINTTEVRLAVTVRDTLGQAVAGLQAADFMIYDNGKRYEPTQCAVQRAPLQLLLLIDETSGLTERAAQLNALLRDFCQSLAPADRFAVMQFAEAVTLTRDWTAPAAAPATFFERARRPQRASIYDALLCAALKLNETPNTEAPRRVIILLTNGLNDAGLADAAHALGMLQASGITLYAFSETAALAAALEKRYAPPFAAKDTVALLSALLSEAERTLALLTEGSGGKLYFPLQTPSLRWMLKDISHELRSQYVLTYLPELSELEAAPIFHQIRVLVRDGHEAVTRAGYLQITPAPRHEARHQFVHFLPRP